MAAALAVLTSAGLTARPMPGGKLYVEPATRLTDDLRQYIRSHKADILAELAANDSGEVAGCDPKKKTQGLAPGAERQLQVAVAGCTPKKGHGVDDPSNPDMRLSVLALHPCGTCYWRRTPGAARLGYCTGRDDLPLAYGLLHELPDDMGESCGWHRLTALR